jgi:GMP synthase (glutamine-hydrolysing)
VLGVCLGAQFISQALGAGFERSPHREIGVFPVALTDEGKRDPLLHDFPDIFDVAHWHGDMPGLTPESKVLAASQGCPRQIVRYAPTVYGFQCHFEFTVEAVDDMIANSRRELEQFKGQRFVESPAQLRAHEYGPMNELLFCFLNRLTARGL